MQQIGFGLKNIYATRFLDFGKHNISTQIEFINVEKDTIPLLKDLEAVKISFKFSVVYEAEKKEKLAEVIFEGHIILSATKEELKQIMKSWKKKAIPPSFQIPLYNTVLKRCSVKAAQLEEELGIPSHLPIPQVKPKMD